MIISALAIVYGFQPPAPNVFFVLMGALFLVLGAIGVCSVVAHLRWHLRK